MIHDNDKDCEVTLLAESLAGEARIWLEKVDEFNPFEHAAMDEESEAAKMEEWVEMGNAIPLRYEAYFWFDKQKNLDNLDGEFGARLDAIKEKLTKQWEEEDG